MDVFFLHPGRPDCFYNATLRTTRCAYRDAVENAAFDRSWDLAPEEGNPIADSGDVRVREEWALDPGYRYGVGLHAVIDVPFLTVEGVNKFIARFREPGPEYSGGATFTWKFDELEWSPESNLLLDPHRWNEVRDGR